MSYARALRAPLLAFLLSPLTLVACGEPSNNTDTDTGGETAGIDCETTPAPKFAEMAAVWAKCTSCHASTLMGAARNAAPDGVDFDSHAAAMANAMKAMDRVDAGTMPPAGSPELSTDESDQLVRWAACGTPE